MNGEEIELSRWLADHGVSSPRRIVPVNAGLGATTLWRIYRAGGESDLLARVFPPGRAGNMTREIVAMRAASQLGMPVPDVVASGHLADCPILVTAWAPGETVGTVMQREPEQAKALGRRLGVTMARLHHIVAPDNLALPERWIERGGAALVPVHAQLRALPDADRLLHLDYHPENVLMLNGEVTAVIDWENTLPGPPHIDLGRSRATLQMIQSLPDRFAEFAGRIAQFEAGLVDGHASVHGADPHPELSLAWGVASICVDFERQVENPESWVTAELVAQLREKRDALIATCRS